MSERDRIYAKSTRKGNSLFLVKSLRPCQAFVSQRVTVRAVFLDGHSCQVPTVHSVSGLSGWNKVVPTVPTVELPVW